MLRSVISLRKKPIKFNSIGNIRNMFIETEKTPNPQSMKFLPGREVLPEEYGTGMVIIITFSSIIF